MRGAAQPTKLLIIDGTTNELPPLKEMTPNMQGGGGGVSPAALRTRVKGKLREGRVADPGDGEGVRMHFREVMRFHGQLYFTIIILPIASR